MGGADSKPEGAPGEFDGSPLDEVRGKSTYCRMDGEEIAAFNAEDEFDDGESIKHTELVKMAFNGVWSLRFPKTRGPCPRSKHFTCYSKELGTLFIGYGMRAKGEVLSDVWALDVHDYTWTRLKLTGDRIEPRTGSCAVMMGNHIVVFGGVGVGKRYFADLHTIDITTGEVILTEARGRPPRPRKGAVMGIWKRRLYIWGGNDGEAVDEINVLDFDQMRWGYVNTSVLGRQSAAWTQVGSRIYVYGGSSKRGFVIVDMENCDAYRCEEECGVIPSAALTGPGICRAGDYLVFFGGKHKNGLSMVYACEMKRMWWFVFFVAPDGESTSVVDGKISSDGLFLLPRMWWFSSCYIPEKRQILVTLGCPMKRPPPISILSIGDALAVLNLRQDMMAMFELSVDGAGDYD